MKRNLILICLIVILGCGTSHHQNSNKEQQIKDQITQYMQREISVSTKHAIKSEDDYFKLEVMGKGQVEISKSEENFYYLSWPIGTLVPMECYLYKERIDSAGSIKNMIETITKSADQKGYTNFKAGVVDHTPFLWTDTFYSGTFQDKKVISLLKVAIAALPENSFACVHNELGYSKTFGEIFQYSLKNLKIKNNQSEYGTPKYNEVSLISFDNIPLGYTQNLIYNIQSKNLHFEFESTVFPKSLNEINFSDNVIIKTSDQEGIVHEASYVSVVNGEMLHQIALEKESKSFNYNMKGTNKTNKVENILKTQNGIFDFYKEAQIRKDSIVKYKKFQISEYVPSLDHNNLTPIDYTVLDFNKGAFELKLRDQKFSGNIDSSGYVKELKAPQLKMVIKRVDGSESLRDVASKKKK